MREAIASTKRWVIHIESRLITAPDGLNTAAINRLAAALAALNQRGIDVVVVSAGATAAVAGPANGAPLPLHEAQALAAIGQIRLTNAWAQGLAEQGLQSAQILLTQDDLSHRKHYLNARSTLQVLLGKGVVPVVSENGAVASHGIRAGDTDSLGALVVNLVQADVYVLLTEVRGLLMPGADAGLADTFIDEAAAGDAMLDRCAHDMTERLGFDVRSWLRSARLAARSGAHTVIADGRQSGVLDAIARGAPVGTLLTSDTHPAASGTLARQSVADARRAGNHRRFIPGRSGDVRHHGADGLAGRRRLSARRHGGVSKHRRHRAGAWAGQLQRPGNPEAARSVRRGVFPANRLCRRTGHHQP